MKKYHNLLLFKRKMFQYFKAISRDVQMQARK